jgi:hypothetical protein
VSFEARFNGGPCGACDERVREGQEVEYDGTGRLVHVICPEALDVDEAPDVCPGCNMALPKTGRCDDCD